MRHPKEEYYIKQLMAKHHLDENEWAVSTADQNGRDCFVHALPEKVRYREAVKYGFCYFADRGTCMLWNVWKHAELGKYCNTGVTVQSREI